MADFIFKHSDKNGDLVNRKPDGLMQNLRFLQCLIIRLAIVLIVFPGISYARNFGLWHSTGYVENFNTESAWTDLRRFNNTAVTFSHDSVHGWPSAGCAKLTLRPNMPEDQEAGLTDMVFNPSATGQANVGFVAYMGGNWNRPLYDGSEWKFIMVEFLGCSGYCSRPIILDRNCGPLPPSGWRVWQACGSAGGDCQDEFDEAYPVCSDPHTWKPDFKEQQYVYIEYEIDDDGNNTLYVWPQDGSRGTTQSSGRLADTPNVGTLSNQANLRIVAYLEGTGATTADSYMCIDHVRVDDRYMGPPAGFFGSTPSPTVLLSASPTSIISGQSSTLTWSSTNATSCTSSGGWTGTKTTSGSENVSPTTTSLYTLTCTGDGGSGNASATVNVTASGGSEFFNEGWESGTKTTFNSSFYGNLTANANYIVQNSIVGSGAYALRFNFRSGEMTSDDYGTQHIGDSIAGPVWATRSGETFDDIYIQYKVYYSNGFDFSSGAKQLIIGTQDSRRHDNACCNPWVSHYIFTATYGGAFQADGNNKQAASGQWFGLDPNVNGYSQSNLYLIQTGRWYTVEVRMRLNDSGQDNGIFQMWVDDVLVSDYRSVRFRIPWDGTFGDDFTYGTNFVLMSNYIETAATQNQQVYYDDVKISVFPIGGSAPSLSAPTNFRILQ